MKKIITIFILAICQIFFVQNALAKELSKKEVKLYKKHIANMAGNKAKKVFVKDREVLMLDNSLAFRVEAKQTEQTSHKMKTWQKFSAIAQLEGIDDSVFQEITEEYNRMYIERLKAIGMKIITIDEAREKEPEIFAKLIGDAEPSTGNPKVKVKKNWGVSRVFTPKNQYAIDINYFKPFGPHAKLPKKLDAVLMDSYTNINFAKMGIDIKQSIGEYSIYTQGKSSMSAQIFIDNDSTIFNLAPKNRGYHIRFIGLTEKEFDKILITSDISFANAIDECNSCPLGFSTGGFIKDTSTGTLVVKADPEKYKAAVLDALSNYLDVLFTLYTQK